VTSPQHQEDFEALGFLLFMFLVIQAFRQTWLDLGADWFAVALIAGTILGLLLLRVLLSILRK
jgi:hypothetical protein